MARKKEKDREPYSLYLRNGIYYVRLWDESAKKYTTAKSTKESNFKKACNAAEKMIDAGQLVKREKDPLFIDELLKYYNERNDICSAYRTDILNRIEKKAAISPHLKDVRMSEISHAHINRLKEDLKKSIGNGETAAGINNLIKNIKTFIRWANTLDYIRIDFTSKIPLLKVEKGKRGWLEPEEMIKLSTVEWHDLRTVVAVHLGMFAGMRWGEVRSLQWGDIDFEKDIIDIKRNFVDDWDENGNPIYKAPKANSFRRYPYLAFPQLKNSLLQLYNETPFNGVDDLVLCNVWKKPEKQYLLKQYKPLTYQHIQKNFHKMLEAAGMSLEEQKFRNISYHSLRHSFASYMATNATAAAVMGLTGHENEKVYEGYRHNLQSASVNALYLAAEKFKQYEKNKISHNISNKPDLVN